MKYRYHKAQNATYKIVILSILLLLIAASAFPEDRVYTNKDLRAEPPIQAGRTSGLEPLIKSVEFNWSFDDLHKYIERKLAEVRIPEYEIYLRPLAPGMSQEEVKQRWAGGRITGGYGEHGQSFVKPETYDVQTINYEIGVSLYFENNRLKGWKTYKPRPIIVSNSEKVIDKKERRPLPEDEEVKISVKGCQTMQEAMDGKPGHTDAVFTVLRHGRTIEEICDTAGQGCKYCGEAPH